jgi:hypothetical protein
LQNFLIFKSFDFVKTSYVIKFKNSGYLNFVRFHKIPEFLNFFLIFKNFKHLNFFHIYKISHLTALSHFTNLHILTVSYVHFVSTLAFLYILHKKHNIQINCFHFFISTTKFANTWIEQESLNRTGMNVCKIGNKIFDKKNNKNKYPSTKMD